MLLCGCVLGVETEAASRLQDIVDMLVYIFLAVGWLCRLALRCPTTALLLLLLRCCVTGSVAISLLLLLSCCCFTCPAAVLLLSLLLFCCFTCLVAVSLLLLHRGEQVRAQGARD